MAEIHDQFDTILILDFGSQVLIVVHFVSAQLICTFTVQPSDYSEMQRTQCLCRAYALYYQDRRRQV